MVLQALTSSAHHAMLEDKYASSKEFLRVYALLFRAAEQGKPVTYGEVAAIMGLPPEGQDMGKKTGQMVGEISRREHECGRPMLSALVVHSGDRLPGVGFFELARLLGRLPQGATRQEELAFWKQERQAVYDAWAS